MAVLVASGSTAGASHSTALGAVVVFYYRSVAIVPYGTTVPLDFCTTAASAVVGTEVIFLLPWLVDLPCSSTAPSSGSTALLGLRVGVTVGFFPPLYKGGLLPQKDYLFPS